MRLDTSSIMKHLRETLTIALNALLKNEWVIRITEGSIQDDTEGTAHVLVVRLILHVEPRTQQPVLPEVSQESRPEPSGRSHSPESHTDSK